MSPSAGSGSGGQSPILITSTGGREARMRPCSEASHSSGVRTTPAQPRSAATASSISCAVLDRQAASTASRSAGQPSAVRMRSVPGGKLGCSSTWRPSLVGWKPITALRSTDGSRPGGASFGSSIRTKV